MSIENTRVKKFMIEKRTFGHGGVVFKVFTKDYYSNEWVGYKKNNKSMEEALAQIKILNESCIHKIEPVYNITFNQLNNKKPWYKRIINTENIK